MVLYQVCSNEGPRVQDSPVPGGPRFKPKFDLWPVYSGEQFRAFRPSCLETMAALGLKVA